MTWVVLTSALWLGVLTAISPCPMATNVAAISFIGRQLGNRRAVLLSGLLYILGRALVYIVLAVCILAGLAAAGGVSRFLQAYLNELLGPVLILLGMILLGLLAPPASLAVGGTRLQAWAARAGIVAALPLGALFALSFCPVSAGLFFGALLPLCLHHQSRLLLPLIFGIGTALPVVVFAFLIAFSTEALGKAFKRLSTVERWVRLGAGALCIAAGIYLSLAHIYGVL